LVLGFLIFRNFNLGNFAISVSAESSKDIQVAPLRLENKKIDFTYTDDNSEENLIIKTDERTYISLTRADVYFSVTNVGNESELTNIQVHFPEDRGEVKTIERWTENVPYEVDAPDFDAVSYGCEEGWEKIADEKVEEIFGQYQCQTTEETRNCDSLSEDN